MILLVNSTDYVHIAPHSISTPESRNKDMPFHAIAVLPAGKQKTLPNRSEDQMLFEVVSPFVEKGIISARWGTSLQSYQVLELRIYETEQRWDKRTGALSDHIGSKRNQAARFIAKARKISAINQFRVFLIMPIQGEQSGSQEEQRVYREYNERFQIIEKIIRKYGGVAIRIDKEHTLDELVARIKTEIQESRFVIADLTDERPSCYFEVGYADALRKPVVYIASKQSVTKPGSATKIHFDIHMNVNFFSNHNELRERLVAAIDKNKSKLLPQKSV